MNKVITFYSPKTAGASSVALNVACLHHQIQPEPPIGFIEHALWSTQQTLFQKEKLHNWAELLKFHKTKEWDDSLLPRGVFTLGPEVLWSPMGPDWPEFSSSVAEAWLTLLQSRYSVLYVDLNPSVPEEWQDFWLAKSTRIVGVVSADPVSMKAWECWSENILESEKLCWVLNQVSAKERKKLLARFSAEKIPLLGVLRQEIYTFWQQNYQGFPVAWQRWSGFKKDLLPVLKSLLSA